MATISWRMVYDEVDRVSPYDRLQELVRAEPNTLHRPLGGGSNASRPAGNRPDMRRELDLLINCMSADGTRAMFSNASGQRDSGIPTLDWVMQGKMRPRGLEQYATIDQ